MCRMLLSSIENFNFRHNSLVARRADNFTGSTPSNASMISEKNGSLFCSYLSVSNDEIFWMQMLVSKAFDRNVIVSSES